MSIPTLLTNYLAAKAAYAEAKRLMSCTLRTTAKLAQRAGGSDAAWAKACNITGVELCDHRCLAACQAEQRARAALIAALCCVLELPRAANDPSSREGR